MFFLKVKAKVPRIEEEQIGKNYRDLEDNETTYIWGPMSIRVEDVDKLWGQSLNRSVIALYSGETVLVAEAHASLHDRVEKLMKEREEKGEEIRDDITEDEEVMDEEGEEGEDTD